jgi:hypothetical protein
LARIRPIWRWLVGLVSALIFVLLYGAYTATRAINGYYFHDYSFPVPSVPGIAFALVAVYLLLVAVSGRWHLCFKAK